MFDAVEGTRSRDGARSRAFGEPSGRDTGVTPVSPTRGEAPLSILDIWADGLVSLGASCKIASSLVAESVAAAGFDYVYVDQQHGVTDYPSLLAMLQAIAGAGAIPATRVSANRADVIGSALDFGAMVVMIPQVETAAEAAAAAAACRFPPRGNRSHGSLRPAADHPAHPDDVDRIACVALVETVKGVANVDEIAATRGVDAIMVGPQDLTLSLGLPLAGDWLASPVLGAAIEEIRVACHRHGKVVGIGVADGESAGIWIGRGFRMINIGNDLGHMTAAMRSHLRRARSPLDSAVDLPEAAVVMPGAQ